jgi:hypothetical protein
MANDKTIGLAAGGALILLYFLSRNCCTFIPSPAIDRPFIPEREQAAETDENQNQNRRQPPSRGGGDGPLPPHPKPPTHPGGGIVHHVTKPTGATTTTKPQTGSYWDWLKEGGGLNPNNPYHPFPWLTSPAPGGAPPIEEPIPDAPIAWGKQDYIFGIEGRLTIA